jgi:hypothetical protein
MFLKDYEGNVDISGNIDSDDASINDITCDGEELSHKFSMVLKKG